MTIRSTTRNAVGALRSVITIRRPQFDRVAPRLRRSASIADLRQAARRALPRGVFDYIDGGAEDERTLVSNSSAFGAIEFKARVLRDVGALDPSTTILGAPSPLPLVLAPTGLSRIANGKGELAVARAAARAGIPYTLSTVSSRSIEEVAEVSDGAKWFQLYVSPDRGFTRELVERAAAAGYEALVVTVDSPTVGKRERDMRRGLTLPPTIGLGTIIDGVIHPRWTLDFLREGPIEFANYAGRDAGAYAPGTPQAGSNFDLDPTMSWNDIEWLRSTWDGPIVLKGIQTVDDAVLAADSGVQAIALSNHGGRQLDCAQATVSLVAPVADAVSERIEIICDGGIRRGSDIVKAVALGARACMVGRAYLYGLGAGGERGVDRAIELLGTEVRRTMALLGTRTVAEITAEMIAVPGR